MTAPNIAALTTIYGKTKCVAVTTSATAMLSNGAASGKVLRINSVRASNIDGTNSAWFSVYAFDTSENFSAYLNGAATVLAPQAAVELIDRPVYLEEGDSIGAIAQANGDVTLVISYDEIG